MKPESVSHRPKPVILVVDDEPINLKIISAALRTRGYEVEVADGGAQAMQWLERSAPDLILLDVMMPEMDGFELCERLKSKDDWRGIPVLFVMANADQESRLRGFALGGQDYIPKPIQVAELLARVDAQMDLVLARQQIRADLERRSALLQILCQNLKVSLALIECEVKNCAVENLPQDPACLMDVSMSVTHAVQHALALIDLVQASGRDEDFDVPVHPVNLGKALDDALQLYKRTCQTKHIDVVNGVDPGLVVTAEYVSLVHCVLGALLGNAIKYSQCGGQVNIDAKVVNRETDGDALVLITFVDSGIGLPQDVAPEKLLEIDGAGRREGTLGEAGVGYGLFLAQRFALSFGGDLSLAQRDDGRAGCRACLSLTMTCD